MAPPSKRRRTSGNLAGDENVTPTSASVMESVVADKGPSDIPPPASFAASMSSTSPDAESSLNGTLQPKIISAAELEIVCAHLKLSPPPRAGLVHPNGYHTNPPPTGRPVRIYADGVFDLFHLGHMRQLQQTKQAFPEVYLIVGVTGDEETLRRKGLTVLPAKDRAESVRHCRWVDEVVEDCPWIIADQPEFIEKHKIDYIAHDDIPYGADEGDDIYAPIKKDGKFLVTQRTEGVSTTGIITQIVRDYELYIMRQLKRGTTRKELNISWLKKNELDIKRAMSELRDNVWQNWSTTGQELGRDLRHLLQPISRPPSPGRGLSHDDEHTSPTRSTSGHLLPPHSPNANSRAASPLPTVFDFASGYAFGLVSGVRSWMTKSRRPSSRTSRATSPDSESHDDNSSPSEPRGRHTDSHASGLSTPA